MPGALGIWPVCWRNHPIERLFQAGSDDNHCMHAHNDTATNTTANAQHPFAALTPDVVLDALASVGLYGDGRLMALSSYENRVYQVTLEDGQRVVAKFYRPERWS